MPGNQTVRQATASTWRLTAGLGGAFSWENFQQWDWRWWTWERDPVYLSQSGRQHQQPVSDVHTPLGPTISLGNSEPSRTLSLFPGQWKSTNSDLFNVPECFHIAKQHTSADKNLWEPTLGDMNLASQGKYKEAEFMHQQDIERLRKGAGARASTHSHQHQ